MKNILLFSFISLCICNDEKLDLDYDKITLLTGQTYFGNYIASEDEFIIFKPKDSPNGQKVEKNNIKLVQLVDGTIVYSYSANSSNIDNAKLIESASQINNAGQYLEDFRTKFYSGYFMQVAGISLMLLSTIDEGTPPLLYAGGLISFVGGVVILLSFNDIGNAGEELKDANEILAE